MSTPELKLSGSIAYREATPDSTPRDAPVLCLHGFPESSFMWRAVLSAAAGVGQRAIAPDLPGFGRSAPDPPATWERLVEAVEGFVVELDLPPVVLVVHDWGGLIGLRWACDHPERIAGLVIANTGFFPDGRWHGMAAGLQTKGTGEQMLGALDRDSLGQMMAAVSPAMATEAIDEYWRSLGTADGQRAVLEMYRSGDFSKLIPYEGRLATLGVPTLILWGEQDDFAPIGGAHRLHREIPGSELRIIDGAGHFLFSDAPEQSTAAVAAFLPRFE